MDVLRFLCDWGKWSLRRVGFYSKLRTSPQSRSFPQNHLVQKRDSKRHGGQRVAPPAPWSRPHGLAGEKRVLRIGFRAVTKAQPVKTAPA